MRLSNDLADDMSENFRLHVTFAIAIELVEEVYGALGNLKGMEITIGGKPSGKPIIYKKIVCNFQPSLRQIEEQVARRSVESVPLAIQGFRIMRRVWLGPQGVE